MDHIGTLLPATPWRTRFAPAPTGELHLGHLVNVLYIWGIARAWGGTVVLRIEDHDQSRSRKRYEQRIVDDLDWLGLEPDEDLHALKAGTSSRYRQSDNNARYELALASLGATQQVYPCICTRSDIEQVAGHLEGRETPYPGTCRFRNVDPAATPARRVHLPAHVQRFRDLRLGVRSQFPSKQCGDLLLRDRLGQWTYQFAVVIDDMDQDIDVVIRGEDLLESTGRQLQLAAMLGRTKPIRFLHHALVRLPDGTKLSKSSGDTALRELREQGSSREELFGRAAQLGGLVANARAMTFAEIVELFR